MNNHVSWIRICVFESYQPSVCLRYELKTLMQDLVVSSPTLALLGMAGLVMDSSLPHLQSGILVVNVE